MKELHISMTDVPNMEGPINACIGYFDGIHKGHQQLIKAVLQRSKENGATPALITFSPDPWIVIKGIDDVPHLTTMKERKAIAEAMGVELWIILDFTKEMAELNVADFHTRILYPLHLDTLVCGFDFHYAHFGKGNVQSLQNDSKFSLVVIDEVSREHEKISSTRIEQAIKAGEMELCEALLTRPYQISGVVVHGLKNGRKMGYPTANMHMQDAYIIPKDGVYAGSVICDGKHYDAMINVGSNPTFKEDQAVSIEAHIFDFNQDIYGEQVSFVFYMYMRSDVRFTTIDALIEQLEKDKVQARTYLTQRRKECPVCD